MSVNTALTTTPETTADREIEVFSKKQYEKVARKNKRLTQTVKDYENIIKLMRLRQTYEHKFISDYLKPRHKPKYDYEDHELWSKDGKHYYKINRNTLETDDDKHRVIVGVSGDSRALLPIDQKLGDKEVSRLAKVTIKIAGSPPPLVFSDPTEEEEER